MSDPQQIIFVNRIGNGADPISLVNGFGYAGGNPPGVEYTATFSLLNFNTTILAWNMSGNVNGGFFAAASGPAWATRQQTCQYAVDVNNGALVFHSTAPYSQAGFVLGASLNASITFSIKQWQAQWVGGWDGHFQSNWNTIFAGSTEIVVDILNILINVILDLLQKKGNKETLLQRKSLYTLYQFYADSSSPIPGLKDADAPLTLTPQLSLKIDFANYVQPLRVLNTALDKVGGGIGFGPLIGIGLPIHLTVCGLQLDGATFPLTGAGSDSSYVQVDTTYSGRSYNSNIHSYSGVFPNALGSSQTYTPKMVGIQYQWSWGIDLTLGLWLSVKLCAGLGFSPSYTFNLLQALGINTNLQSKVQQTLTTTSGIQGSYLSVLAPDREVVFEFPDGSLV